MAHGRSRKNGAAHAAPKKDAEGGAAYFLSLTVENVRCFGEKQTLDLSDGQERPRQWTVILGNNGLGKTTLLQVLAGFVVDTWPTGGKDKEPTQFRRAHILGGDLVRTGAGESSIRASFASGGMLSDQTIRFVTSSASLKKGLTRTEVIGGQDVRCVAYGAARRLGNAALVPESAIDPVINLFDDQVSLRDAEEWLLQADYSAAVAKGTPHEGEAVRPRDDVKAMLLEVLPEVLDIEILADAGDNPRRPKPEVRFKTPYGWVPLRGLSLGYKALIAWTVDLAGRLYDAYPDSADPLGEPAVVLVDEIDLHLHPRWQRDLVAYLTERFPNVQFVVTAHSPLIVQAAADANIVVLRRDGDHVVIDNHPESVRGFRVDRILLSELFGLPGARAPEDIEERLARREHLLAKSRLTAKDRRELETIEQEIGDLPYADSREDIRAMDLIRRAAAQLEASAKR